MRPSNALAANTYPHTADRAHQIREKSEQHLNTQHTKYYTMSLFWHNSLAVRGRREDIASGVGGNQTFVDSFNKDNNSTRAQGGPGL